LALFGQGFFMTPLAIVTIGGRYEHHSAYGDAFAPRLALTRQFKDSHVKLMTGRAFRSPSIANVAYNPGIVTVNVFDQAIDHPIVYGFTGSGTYENGRSIGSRGAEAIVQYRAGPIDVNVAYSNSVITRNGVPEYAVPGDDDNLLAFPTHKATASVTGTPLNDLHVTPSAMFVSERWAITEEDSDGNPVYDELVPSTLVNLHVLKRNAFAEGLDISGGVRNLFDEDFGLIQAYYRREAPTPTPPGSSTSG
jgi:outer membrane receptor for ferrienterochelin and colicin